MSLTNCSTDKNESDVSTTGKTQANTYARAGEIVNLNTTENRKAISDLFKDENSLNQQFGEYLKNYEGIEDVDFNNLISEYQNCSYCPSDYKNFLIPFFQEIIETDNSNIISVIERYESNIDKSNIDQVHKENLKFTFFAFKEGGNYALNKLANSNVANRENSPGKNIGRGLAWGFLTGCATGAYIGGTVGTVTVPVLGTAVGAVAGCIYGGAFTGSMGAIGASVWSLVDSIF